MDKMVNLVWNGLYVNKTMFQKMNELIYIYMCVNVFTLCYDVYLHT